MVIVVVVLSSFASGTCSMLTMLFLSSLGALNETTTITINKQAASFGPFDRQVLVMNTDGKTFTLLENPVAMRLKQAGFINDRRIFIKQPTADDLAKAESDAAASSGGLFQGLFGS
jgi:hypothetical protein